MTVCGNCQYRNPPGNTFCDSCGDYLRWSGGPDEEEPSPPPPAPAPEEEAEPEPAPAPPTPAPPPPVPAAAGRPVAHHGRATTPVAHWTVPSRPRPAPPAPPPVAEEPPPPEEPEEPEEPEPEEPEPEEPGVAVADDKADEILGQEDQDQVPFFPGETDRRGVSLDDGDEDLEEDEEEEDEDEEEEPPEADDRFWFRRLVDDAGRRREGLPPLFPEPKPRPRPEPRSRPRPRPGARTGTPAPAPARARTGAARPRPSAAGAPLPPRTGPPTPLRLPGRARVTALLAAASAPPVLRPSGDDTEPVLRQPGAPTARVPLRPQEEDGAAPRPGDVVCPVCRTANGADRFFCLRCGHALRDEKAASAAAGPGEEAVRRRWWHRFLRRREPERPWSDPLTLADVPGNDKATALLAGAKEPWRDKVKRLGPVALGALLVVAVAGPLRSPLVRRLESVRKVLVPKYEQIYPEQAAATSSLPEHEPELAVDNAPNTYWAEGSATRGDGEILYITFEKAVDLGRIGITSGAQTKPQDFLSQPRPREVVVTYDDGDPQRITLKDKAAFQSFEVHRKKVRVVAIRIASVYVSPLGGTATSIGEVEFFVKR